jgi:hypothetical protein
MYPSLGADLYIHRHTILYTHLTTVHPALGEKKGTNFKGRCLTRFNRLHAWPEEIPRYECLD